MKTEVFTFKVIIVKDIESNCYFAHCLELDLVATHNNIRDDCLNQVAIAMSELINVQLTYCLENDNLAYFYKPAPISDWKLFFNCQDRQIEVYYGNPIIIDDIEFTPEIRLEKCFLDK
jgi:predicted RNase H-like HicB family nuclease